MSAIDKRYEPSDRFETARRHLLRDVVAYTEGNGLRQGFMRDFFEYLRDIDFQLVKDGEDFYARFTRDMKRGVDFSLAWPLATVVKGSEIQLLVNPISFLFLREAEARALIKHEVLHLILDHHSREHALKNRYSSLAINLAMDVAVNQYIKFLPAFSEKLNSVNARLELDLKFNETLETYARDIDRALARDRKAAARYQKEHGIDFSRVHDAWNRGNDLKKEASREKLSAMLREAGKGGTPEELKNLIQASGPAKLSWSDALRRALISMPAGRRKTITRRNRRQPHRLDLKGELRDYVPEVIVAIDISASIQDHDLKHFLSEILGITKAYRRSLRVIECDDKIQADYRIAALTDIRPMTRRRGGTAFSPVFERLRDEGLRQCFLIYFTDGQGEAELTLKPQHQVLWIVTGDSLSVKKPFGQVIRLNREQEVRNATFGLEAMRELLHEWAR